MKKIAGFTVIEVLVVTAILAILATLTLISIGSHRRMVKTEDAGSAIFTLMRQARLQSITRRQFYAVVINIGPTQTIKVHPDPAATLTITFPAQTVSLVDMGGQILDDETLALSKKFPIDVIVNASTGLPAANPAFPLPERSFVPAAFTNNIYILYFDPAGRAVTTPDGKGNPIYTVFYFSSFDVNLTKGPTLLRALTVYGATGGLKFWRYIPTMAPPQWITQLS